MKQACESRDMKLLWTNPNPSSDFAAQTVTLPKNSYNFYYVEGMTTKGDANSYSNGIVKVGGTGQIYEVATTESDKGTLFINYRHITGSSSDSITFGGGRGAYHNGLLKEDKRSVPKNIYGFN